MYYAIQFFTVKSVQYVKKLYCIINKKCAFCWFKKCVIE
jgi:hypothetical protein